MKNSNKIIVVIITIIVFVIAIILYGKYRGLRERIVCSTNLKVLGTAMNVYTDKHNDRWPTKDQWCDLLLKNSNITSKNLRCPSEWNGPCNYSINVNLPIYKKDTPEDMVLLFESIPGWNQVGNISIFNPRRITGDGGHVLYADGFVEFVSAEEIPNLRWTVESSNQK